MNETVIFFINQILDGVAKGAIYGTLALALVFIYRSTKIFNFGQGEVATFSAYLMLLALTKLPPAIQFLAFPLVIITSALLGALLYLIILRPVSEKKDGSELNELIVTIGF